jgi:two-component system, OmpR family, phosphate regulon sensor histidine kinase PhoR
MFSQLVLFAMLLALGAALGQTLAPAWGGGAAIGVAAAALAVWVYAQWGAARVLHWLRQVLQNTGAEHSKPVRTEHTVPVSSPSSAQANQTDQTLSKQAPTGWLTAPWRAVAERSSKLMRQSERSEQMAAQRLQDFLSAIQASPNGVVLLDAQQRIEWCNQTAAKHLGLEPARDLWQHMTHLLREPGFVRYLERGVYDSAVLLELEHGLGLGLRTRKGLRKISLQAHRYGAGRLLLLTNDVTELEQAEAMRRDFVANVSHEIRTPLTVLSGLIESLQNLPLNESERSNSLHIMQAQAARMNSLVADLLSLSRLESSPPPPSLERVSIQTLLQLCEQEAHKLSAGRHQLRFPKLDLLKLEGAAQPHLKGSQTELQSALSNLVSNAVRYTPAGGTISVMAAQTAQGGFQFSVRDTGAGIAPEHIARLTERFYRVDSSRSRDTGGTGLGLAIVKHVAQRHGAQLLIESQLGQGSVFCLIFDAARVAH